MIKYNCKKGEVVPWEVFEDWTLDNSEIRKEFKKNKISVKKRSNWSDISAIGGSPEILDMFFDDGLFIPEHIWSENKITFLNLYVADIFQFYLKVKLLRNMDFMNYQEWFMPKGFTVNVNGGEWSTKGFSNFTNVYPIIKWLHWFYENNINDHYDEDVFNHWYNPITNGGENRLRTPMYTANHMGGLNFKVNTDANASVQTIEKLWKVNYLMKIIYEGGETPYLFYDEEDALDSKMDNILNKVKKRWEKSLGKSALSTLGITKKDKMKRCDQVLEKYKDNELLSGYKCEYDTKKAFKNCCMMDIMKLLHDDDLTSQQRLESREIEKEIFGVSADFYQPDLSLDKKTPMRSTQTFKGRERSEKHDELLKEFLSIPIRPDGHVRKRYLRWKGGNDEKYTPFSDYIYKVFEFIYSNRDDLVQMFGERWVGILISNYYEKMNYISNPREHGSRKTNVAYHGKGRFVIEKLFRWIESNKNIKMGFRNKCQVAGGTLFDFLYIHRTSNESFRESLKNENGKVTLYRGCESPRSWIGHSWSYNEYNAVWFSYIHKDRSSDDLGHSHEGSRGYICEYETEMSKVLAFRDRSALNESEVILLKKDLDPSKVIIKYIELTDSDTHDFKVLKELSADEVPRNLLFEKESFPDYLY